MGFQPFLYLLWKNRVTWDANHSCIYYRRTELRIFLIGTILHLSASVLVPVWRRHHLLLSPLLCEKCVKTSPAYIPTPWEECVKTSPASVPTSMWRMLEDITCFCPHPHVKNVWRYHLLLSPPHVKNVWWHHLPISPPHGKNVWRHHQLISPPHGKNVWRHHHSKDKYTTANFCDKERIEHVF